MLNHYLKMAIRSLLRNRIFSIINILGLAVGMGVCLLIFQYIHFELSFDNFHKDADRIYRLTTTEFRNGEDFGTGVYTTYGLGPAGKEASAKIEEVVRIRPQDEDYVVINPQNNESYLEGGTWYVDSNFLNMFELPLAYGDVESSLREEHNVVITENIANKYFGRTNPLGKTLRFSLGNLTGDFIITGVLKSLPANSHLQFNFLLPLDFLLDKNTFYRESDPDGWGLADFATYLKLNKTADPDRVGQDFEELFAMHGINDFANPSSKWNIELQPITNIHLTSGISGDFARNNGTIQNVQFFAMIAVFILLMAWVNYINLSTAQSIYRIKEVGVRKSIGADNKHLFNQFIVESFLLNISAAAFSILIAFMMLPVLNNILGKSIELQLFQEPFFWVGLSVAVVIGSLGSGLYPALLLASQKPLRILKSTNLTSRKRFSLRQVLIVFQFLMSTFLICGTYLVYKQITFMKNRDLGIDMEKILVVNGARVFLESLEKDGVTIDSKYQTFKNEVANHHSISTVTLSSSVPGRGYFYTENFRKSGELKTSEKEVNIALVDTDFVEGYGLEFVANVAFSKDIPNDQKGIINEAALKTFGLNSAEEALHKVLVNNWGDTIEVVGVVKNSNWNSLRDAHSPMLLIYNNIYGAYYSVNMNLGNIRETITHIETAYHSTFPNDPFDYFFLEDDFNRQYQADLQFGKLFSAFSILAIFIACLGLFALVSFSATLKIKEIGIRKILGASVNNLMLLLSREYLMLLLVAVLISVPVVVYAANSWLNNYAYKVDLGVELLLVPGIILLIISVLTVSFKIYTIANRNPVKSLKSE